MTGSGGIVEATVIGWRLPRVSADWRKAFVERDLAQRFAFSQGPVHSFGDMLARLCQNATQARGSLGSERATEQIAPESAVSAPYPLFTARYRAQFEAAHHIQHHNDRPQPAADDKG